MNSPAQAIGLDLPFAGSNNPPETIEMLLPADDLLRVIADPVDGHINAAKELLLTYARVPDEINDQGVYERATTFATQIQGFLDKIDAERSGHKAPYLKAGQVLDEAYRLKPANADEADKPAGKGAAGRGSASKGLKADLEAAVKSIKNRLSDYDTRQFEIQQAQAEAERLRLAQIAAQDGIVIDEAIPDTTQHLGTVKSAHGGHAVRQLDVDWEVIDETAVPRNLLSPDPAKIKAFLDKGATEIPGLKITKRIKTHVKRG